MAGGWGGKRPGAGAKPKTERVRRAVVAAATGTDLVAAQPKQQSFSFAKNFAAIERVIEASERYARKKTIRPEELNPFRLPAFPPSAIPKQKAHRMALDEAVSWGAAQWSGGVLAGVAAEGLLFLGYPYLSELAQRPEYRVISETIATEMTRKWIKFSGTGDEDKTEKIKELVDFLDALQVRDRYADVALQDGFFGRSHLFHDFGADIDDAKGELASPIGNGRNEFSKTKVGPKTPLRRLKTIEPVWTYPTTYNATNPLADDWYNPQVWYVMGKQIHTSRLLKFIGRPVPDMLKPAYAFGGLSLSQMAKPYVDIWLRTRQSVADIVHSFSVFVLETDLTTILQPGNAGGLIARAAMFNALRDNQGLMVVNKNSEGFQNVSAPLGSLDKLQAQAQEHMAAVARIPLVKLTGISPTGLNASSEGEMRAFYDTINAYQNRFFRPNLTITIDFAMLSLWGEVDQEITYEFEPLWEMTEKEKGEKKKAEAETGQIHIDSGVISPQEERKRIINDPDSAYQGLDPEDVPDLAAEEEEGLEPEGGRPDPKSGGEPDKGGGGEPGKKKGVAEDSVIPFDLAFDAAFNEADHPRAPDGKFGQGSGGGGSPLKVEGLKKVSGQKGSNPGGVYEDGEGRQFYIKQGRSADHVKNELLAASLYQLAGTPTLEYQPVEGGKYIATVLEKLDKDNASKLSAAEKVEAGKDFAVHAWLANWDAVGMGGDNIGTVKGQPTPLDLGGALAYRAQGAPKGDKFGDKVPEIDSLRDPKVNPDSAKLFAAMTPAQLREAALYVTQITDDEIKDAVEAFGGADALADKLIKRRDAVGQWAKSVGSEGDPKKATSSVVFGTGDKLPVKELNGIKFEKWSPPEGFDWNDVDGQADLAEDPLPQNLPKGKKLSSGLIIREPDGRIWIMRPKGGYGGYQGSFPKGRVEPTLSLQANAIKEAWEETGIKARVTGIIGDREGDATMTRYYLAERESGDPTQAGEETDGVVLAPADKLEGFLNRRRDRDLAKEIDQARTGAHDSAGWEETKHPRNPDGEFTSGSGGGSSGGSEGGGIMTASEFMALLNKPAIAGGNYRRALMKAIKQAGDSPHAKTLTGKLIESWSKTHANAVKKGEIETAKKIADKVKKLGGELVTPSVASPASTKEFGKPFEGTKVEKKPKPAEELTPVEKMKPPEKPEPKTEPHPKFPAPTEGELAKAKKNVPLQLQYVPGNEAIKTAGGKGEAQKLVDAFNEKYAGKELKDQPALIQKVNDFKMMAAKMTAITATEAVKAQEWAVQQKAEAAKKAAAQKEIEKKAAAEVAEKNKAVMAELGISETEAFGFNALAKMLGGNPSDVIASFKKYEAEAKQYGYPISGFQCALIKNYSNGGYTHINSALRKGSWSAAQHVYAKMVNKALQAMPRFEGVTKRGASLESSAQALYVVGNVVEERAFTSTSPTSAFGGNTHFTITANGKRGASIKKLSNHPGENEVVFSARTFFHVDKVENKGGVMYVHMTETEAE